MSLNKSLLSNLKKNPNNNNNAKKNTNNSNSTVNNTNKSTRLPSSKNTPIIKSDASKLRIEKLEEDLKEASRVINIMKPLLVNITNYIENIENNKNSHPNVINNNDQQELIDDDNNVNNDDANNDDDIIDDNNYDNINHQNNVVNEEEESNYNNIIEKIQKNFSKEKNILYKDFLSSVLPPGASINTEDKTVSFNKDISIQRKTKPIQKLVKKKLPLPKNDKVLKPILKSSKNQQLKKQQQQVVVIDKELDEKVDQLEQQRKRKIEEEINNRLMNAITDPTKHIISQGRSNDGGYNRNGYSNYRNNQQRYNNGGNQFNRINKLDNNPFDAPKRKNEFSYPRQNSSYKPNANYSQRRPQQQQRSYNNNRNNYGNDDEENDNGYSDDNNQHEGQFERDY